MGFQVFAMPVFDLMESYLVQEMHFTPGRPLRLVARSSYVRKYIQGISQYSHFVKYQQYIEYHILIICILFCELWWHECSFNRIDWNLHSIFWRIARVLWWTCFLINIILCKYLLYTCFSFLEIIRK